MNHDSQLISNRTRRIDRYKDNTISTWALGQPGAQWTQTVRIDIGATVDTVVTAPRSIAQHALFLEAIVTIYYVLASNDRSAKSKSDKMFNDVSNSFENYQEIDSL